MIVLVAGPPCAGKTTYVREHAQPGDDVVDFDEIVDRKADPRTRRSGAQIWKDRVNAPLEEGRTRWVIWTAPRRVDRGRFREQYGAEVVVIWADQGTCVLRAMAERPRMWIDYYIPSWFERWEPSRSGREVVISTTTAQGIGV